MRTARGALCALLEERCAHCSRSAECPARGTTIRALRGLNGYDPPAEQQRGGTDRRDDGVDQGRRGLSQRLWTNELALDAGKEVERCPVGSVELRTRQVPGSALTVGPHWQPLPRVSRRLKAGGYPPQSPGFGGTVAPQQPRPPSSISIDFRRLGTGDIVALGGSVLLFISLFLSWYTIKVSEEFGNIGASTSALGTGAGGWRVLILVIDILVILYLFVRTMTPRGLHLPLPHWQLLTVALGLQFLLTLLAFLVKPSADGVSVSWGYGAFIGLIASIIALAGGIMRRNEAEIVVPGVPAGWFRQLPLRTRVLLPWVSPPVAEPRARSAAQCGTAVPTGTPYCTTCGAPTAG